MLIFTPYHQPDGQLFRSHSRTSPSPTPNGQDNTTMTAPLSGSQATCSTLCCFTSSLLLLIIAIFIFLSTMNDRVEQKTGSSILAVILISPVLTVILIAIALVSFVRICKKSSRYYDIMNARCRLLRGLDERQQADNSTLSLNNNENPESIENMNTDLPSYKQLFPSHLNISNSGSDLPPSYDDYVKKLLIHQPTINPTRSVWITDRGRRIPCTRGSITYV